MLCNDTRNKLREASRFFGGIKAVADLAGVDDGNLSRWLNGGSTLSEEKVAQVLHVLGLPNGLPDEREVHLWMLKRVLMLDLSPALTLYFPDGAEIARAEWSKGGTKANLKRLTNLPWLPEIYAITDGKVRVVMRLPTGLLIQKQNLGKKVLWKNGAQDQAILRLSDESLKTWLEGTPTPQQFDAAWSGNALETSAEDVIRAIRDEGISYEEAIRRIRAKK